MREPSVLQAVPAVRDPEEDQAGSELGPGETERKDACSVEAADLPSSRRPNPGSIRVLPHELSSPRGRGPGLSCPLTGLLPDAVFPSEASPLLFRV